jgi:hypothetical protein
LPGIIGGCASGGRERDHSGADLFPVLSNSFDLFGGERAVARGDSVLRSALDDPDVLGLLGDLLNRLDARRAGSDQADPRYSMAVCSIDSSGGAKVVFAR